MSAADRRHRLSFLIGPDARALFLLSIFFFGTHWPLLVGRVSPHWDAADQFAPYYSFVARTIRSGHLLLWNPFSSGGSPDFAEPQFGALSPFTLIFGLVAGPGPVAFRLYWLCLWWFGGIGMYVLSRALSAPAWGALLVAASFVFSGFYIGHAEHLSTLYTYSFVPWVLWRARAALVGGRIWPACQAGALWGFSALSGNPAVVFPAALFTGLVSLAWVPGRNGVISLSRWRHYAVTMLVLGAVGTVVLAPVYLSFRYEVASFSERALPLSRDLALPSHSLGFPWLTSFFSPLIALCTLDCPGWPGVDVSYVPVYCGAALLVFALLMVWERRTLWQTRVIAVVGLFFLGCALGRTLPLSAWLYDWLPPMRYVRHPPMLRGFFILAVAMLAAPATGLVEGSLQAEKVGSLRALAVCAVAGAALSMSAGGWVLCTVPTALGETQLPLALWHLTIAWIGLAAVCVATVRWPVFRPYFPTALVLITAGDMAGSYALSASVIYDSIPSSAISAPPLSSLELGAAGFDRAPTARNNENLYGPRPVFANYTAMTNRIYAEWGKDPWLLDKVTGTQRVWFSAEAPVAAATPETFAAFRRRTHDLNRLVILRHARADLVEPGRFRVSPDALAAISTAPPAEPAPCRVLSYRANALALSVTCPRPGFLLLTDRWTRSWRASVNGREVPIDGGDFLFRVVPVVAGDNLVQMQFSVPWLYPLLFLSWTVLFAVGIGSIWPRADLNFGGRLRRASVGPPVLLKRFSVGCDPAKELRTG